MKRWMTAALLVVLATAAGAAGQDRRDEAAQRECMTRGDPATFDPAFLEPVCFALWIGCGDIDADVSVGENTIGVREGDIQNAVESRLRAAGVLYTDMDFRQARGSSGDLSMTVSFTDTGAFFVELRFTKSFLSDTYGFNAFGVPTWQRDTFGTHGGSAAFVMEAVRRFLDEFMNEFLRVNAPACAAR